MAISVHTVMAPMVCIITGIVGASFSTDAGADGNGDAMSLIQRQAISFVAAREDPKPASRPPAKPHILFLMADQLDGRVLDPDSPQYQPPMPNLRALAETGAHFRMAYTGSPLCVPARASLMTGRHSSTIGVWNNDFGIGTVKGNSAKLDEHCVEILKDDCRTLTDLQNVTGTFVDALADGGYSVHLYGKVHAGGGLYTYPGKPHNDSPFLVSENVDDLNVREWTRAAGIMVKRPWFDSDGEIIKTRHRGTTRLETFLRAMRDNDGPEAVDGTEMDGWPAKNGDYHTADSCAKLLRQGLFMKKDPQFLYCSFDIPHPPHVSNSSYLLRVASLGELSVPKWAPREDVHPGDKYTSMMKGTWAMDVLQDISVIAEARRTYFAQCEEMDHLIGNILDSLDAGGGRQDSYIIFVSDHGDHNYENRMLEKDSMLEASSRVPIILAGPGIHPSSAASMQLASLHDVFPTVLDMASIAHGGGSAGESLLPLAMGSQRKKDYVIAEYHARFTGTGVFMIRQGDYKLILYGAPQLDSEQWPPQLFDISKDPHEFQNLASEAANAGLVAKMTALLESEVDMADADKRKKSFDKHLFKKYWYDLNGGATKCGEFMEKIYPGFDATDAEKLSRWLGEECHVAEEATNVPASQAFAPPPSQLQAEPQAISAEPSPAFVPPPSQTSAEPEAEHPYVHLR